MKTKLLNIVSKLGLALMLAPVAMAQQPPHLLQDNVVMQAIEPMNWHPEGKNFGFSSSRGTVTNQKGSIKPQMVGNIRVGNFSVQNASLKGVLSYDTVFDNHGHEVHGNFGSTIKSEASEKSNRNDGSQVSYSLKWTATMNHPADAYDGVQGGGYPSPTGARDEYSFDISGVAVGTYLVTEWSMDAAYKPNIDNRNQNYLKALEASQDRNSAKLDKALNNPDRDLEWYHRVIYGFNGTLGLMASPVTGLGGFMQPEFEQASQGIYYLENKSIKDLQGKGTQQQFDAISNWAATYHDIDNASQWLAERPMIGETVEAGGWLVGGYQVAKTGFKSIPEAKIDPWIRTPASIQDQMAMDAAKAGEGRQIMGEMGDPRYKGMVKMEYKLKSIEGKDTVIHYIRDPATGNTMDFKFKKRSNDGLGNSEKK
jgi:hypothetical protein